jgi:hypothetical protein
MAAGNIRMDPRFREAFAIAQTITRPARAARALIIRTVKSTTEQPAVAAAESAS